MLLNSLISSISEVLVICLLKIKGNNELIIYLTYGRNLHDNGSMIRHCVLFSFKETSDKSEIEKIESEFNLLKSVIPEIIEMEWGLNNSPEGKTKGFTHMFLISFNNVYDRDSYLIHPEHMAFSGLAGPHLDDVLVFDYEV